MSGTLAKIATNGLALRAPDAALPRSKLACMIILLQSPPGLARHLPAGKYWK
jgi:hypothetical protein